MRGRTILIVSFGLGLLAFGLVFVVSNVVGIAETMSWECDGPCFDRWDEVFWVSLGLAIAACGLVTLLSRRSLSRRAAGQRDSTD